MRRLACAATLSAITLIGCAPPESAKSSAEQAIPVRWAASASTPLPLGVSYRDVMEGIVGASAFPIFQLSNRDQPLANSEWVRVGAAATNLVATSSLLSMEGQSPEDQRRFNDPNWMKMVTALRDASLALVVSADQQDRSQFANAAFALGQSCKSCHTVFQKAPSANAPDLAGDSGPDMARF